MAGQEIEIDVSGGDGDQSRRVGYIVSEELAKISSLLPSNKGRSALVHSLVSAFGFFRSAGPNVPPRLLALKPEAASRRDLLLYHDEDYIDFVFNNASKKEGFGFTDRSGSGNTADFGLEDDCPYFDALPRYMQLIGGGALTAANALRNDQVDVAIFWDGGRHHAHRDAASGFCYVADSVLSILTLRKGYPRPRIMYLDLDLHFSDGVSEAFQSTSPSSPPTVLTLSIHHTAKGFFPAGPLAGLTPADTSDPFTLSIPLKPGASNPTFGFVWKAIVERVKDAFQPDYVVIQCGADGLAGDPYAVFNWGIKVNEEGSMGWCVQQALGWGVKTMLVGGGGYNSPNTARAWAYLSSIACQQPFSVEADIPDHRGFPLYKPSFTLDVPPGNMQDDNNEEYLNEIRTTFDTIVQHIRERVRPS